MTANHPLDSRIGALARVRDDDLVDIAGTPAAQELLFGITTAGSEDRAAGRLAAPDPTARRRRRTALAAGLLVAASTAAVVGPILGDGVGGASSYANSAIEVTRDGDDFVARIKDPYADHDRYTEAFRAVGKDLDLEFVPVAPIHVGQLISMDTEPNQPAEVRSDLVGTGPGAVDCVVTPARCMIVIRISTDTAATVSLTFGRAARPGERLQDPSRPRMPSTGSTASTSGGGSGTGGGGGR
ncbi:hypothetical protein AB0E69_16210 [Kribbella sp. NPDC026611]|uniref:hypothetical protein n=1 Tax=Kribbella sp. NPDC026611 TaxID=3154911 RepID=UPI0033F4E639